jgi:hypothetical protein
MTIEQYFRSSRQYEKAEDFRNWLDDYLYSEEIDCNENYIYLEVIKIYGREQSSLIKELKYTLHNPPKEDFWVFTNFINDGE